MTFHCAFCCETDACLGIDPFAPRYAPGGELLRIDYGEHNPVSEGLILALAALSAFIPLLPTLGDEVLVLHDRPKARIVLAQAVGEADGLRLGASHAQ